MKTLLLILIVLAFISLVFDGFGIILSIVTGFIAVLVGLFVAAFQGIAGLFNRRKTG
ncbi:MAG: hypothetical protein ACYC9Q_09325 [Bacillota bacterium]